MSSKRGPSVLVTDARERQPGGARQGHQRSRALSPGSAPSASTIASSSSAGSRASMRHVSVDNILQHASEIPSGQPRGPPGSMRLLPSVALSASHRGLARRTSGGYGGAGVGAGVSLAPGVGAAGGVVAIPGAGTVAVSPRAGLPIVPSRTTKISEKLVLLPETDKEEDEDEEDEDEEDDEEETEDDTDADESAWTSATAGENAAAAQSALRQARRAQEDPSVIPLDGERPPRDEELLRRRRPAGKSPGMSYAERLPKARRTEKVARLTAYCTAQAFKMRATAEFLRTQHAAKAKLYDDCLYTVYHLPLLPGHDGFRIRSRPILKTPGSGKTVLDLEIERSERRDEHMGYFEGNGRGESSSSSSSSSSSQQPREQPLYPVSGGRADAFAAGPPSVSRLAPDAQHLAEMFVFSYGVVVFWNFTEQQEKAILADLAFAESATDGGADGVAGSSSSSSSGSSSLAVRPLDEADFETEAFHFEYSSRVKRPRVFNDMITLLPRSDHMVKLTISHAIAQSTKLCFFEEKMSETMQNAQSVPKRLALTGELNMSRTEIVKMLGRLFRSRVDINLSSNILDVPNFFWDAEPTLHPLYVAIREYLEIDPRIQVLNERGRVFLDLAEILADSVADAKMSYITWIIIVLIVVSILVTVTEVSIRFGILSKEKHRAANGSAVAVASGPHAFDLLDSPPALVLAGRAPAVSLDDLRAWGAQLGSQERAAICGSDLVGTTFAGV